MAVSYINWEKVPYGRGVHLIAKDINGVAALEKPPGVLSQPNKKTDLNRSLFRAPFDFRKQAYLVSKDEEEKRYLWLLNRLDSATSGLILVCDSEELARVMKGLFVDRKVQKKYQALAFGFTRESKQVWKDRMAVEKGGNGLRAKDEGGLMAESHMSRLKQISGPPVMSLLELEPKTGRTHQLRYQCAKRKLFIIGDQSYGDFKKNREFTKRFGTKRLFLHSSEVKFRYRFKGKTFDFFARSPLPKEFPR